MASAPRLKLIGIRPSPTSIGPAGHHLRWSFPSAVGFPSGGFSIFRRPAAKSFSKPTCLALSRVHAGTVIDPGSTFDGVSFRYPPEMRVDATGSDLTITAASIKPLELAFAEPAAVVRIALTNASRDTQLIGLDESGEIGRSPGNAARDGFLELRAPSISRVFLMTTSARVTEVCHLSVDAACRDSLWERLVHLPLVGAAAEAITRIESGVRNRWVADHAAAVAKYRPGAAALVDSLRPWRDPVAVTPDMFRFTSAATDTPLPSIDAQSTLLLAALDPNVARMLSLYWVDRFDGAHAPDPSASYHYKVSGEWRNQTAVTCGLLLNLGGHDSVLPVAGAVDGNQLPGLRWRGRDPLGRVGVSWARPAAGQGAVQPVLFDVIRDARSTDELFLTRDWPVLVPSPQWEAPRAAKFVDPEVAIGTHTYALRPIDLFGQIGSAVVSGPVRVRDLEAPPPPVRVEARISQPGYPWRTADDLRRASDAAIVTLRCEYGDTQHRQAPDALRLRVYWRIDSLVDTAVADLSPDGSGVASHRIGTRVVRAADAALDLSRFAGGVASRVGAAGVLPAIDRHHLRIAEASSSQLELASAEQIYSRAFVDDRYRLVSDPRRHANWSALSATIDVRPPLPATVIARATAAGVAMGTLGARCTAVRHVRPTAGPLAQLPAGHRPDRHPEVADVIEIAIDRHLLEADLFAGGVLIVGGDRHPILYSTSGATARACVGIAAGPAIAVGAVVLIEPPITNGSIQAITLRGSLASTASAVSGGEVAFDVVDGDSTKTFAARIVSRSASIGTDIEYVVRMSAAASAHLRTGASVRIHLPYEVTIPIVNTNGTAAAGSLALPAVSDASRHLYLAVTAEDDRGTEGPLSQPAQTMIVKTPPRGAPGRPYPCGQSAAAADGYASPPDRRGRATVCLTWDRGDLDSTNGIRYEVARTLDVSVLADHRRQWWSGRVESPSDLTGSNQTASIETIDHGPGRGLYRVKVSVAVGATDPEPFVRGRLLQPPAGVTLPGARRASFQITRIIAARQPRHFDLVVRASGEMGPTVGPCTLEGQPKYQRVRGDLRRLSQMAAQLPDAFGLVTGVPIEANRFVDEIPGKGRNSFLYRVRAVDAAENRSAWSPISAPFHQVDTTPPEAPRQLRAVSADRAIELRWLRPEDLSITAFEIFRDESADTADSVTPHAVVPRARLSPLGPFTIARSVAFQPQLAVLPGRSHRPDGAIELVANRTTVHAVRGSAAINLFVASDQLTRLDGRRVVRINPLLPDGTRVQVSLNAGGSTLTISHRPGSGVPLTIDGGAISLGVPMAVARILAVVPAIHAAAGDTAADLAASPFAMDLTGLAIDVPALTLSGFPASKEGIDIVVVIERVNGDPFAVRVAPGTDQPLRIVNGAVRLDLPATLGTLASVITVDEIVIDGVSRPSGQDVRLTAASAIDVDRGTGQVIGIRQLNPLVVDGTPVTIGFENATGQSVVHDGDHTIATWRDTEMTSAESYQYRVRAVRSITLLDATGHVTTRSVRGSLTERVGGAAFDRSRRSDT